MTVSAHLTIIPLTFIACFLICGCSTVYRWQEGVPFSRVEIPTADIQYSATLSEDETKLDVMYSDPTKRTEEVNIKIRDLDDKGIIVYERSWNPPNCYDIKFSIPVKYDTTQYRSWVHSYNVIISFRYNGKWYQV